MTASRLQDRTPCFCISSLQKTDLGTRPASGLGSGGLSALLGLPLFFQQALPLPLEPSCLCYCARPLLPQLLGRGGFALLPSQLRLPLRCSLVNANSATITIDHIFMCVVAVRNRIACIDMQQSSID